MKARLLRLQRRLRSKLWFWPGIAAVFAFVAARSLVALDHRLDLDHDAWYVFGGSAESARELLSTVSSSMMAFTGLVFSITILVLQLASGQFSPRVLRTFLEDRNTQLAMAAFVGAFVYALALLPLVRGGADDQAPFVPALAMFVAFVLVLIGVAIFIRYIDHMAHAVRAVSIVKRVAAETRHAIAHLYPDALEGAPVDGAVLVPAGPPVVVPHTGRAGVLTTVDETGLMEAARSSGAVIELVRMPGEFVPHGAPLLRYWAGDASIAERARAAISIEDERTPHQDPAFGFRQLVDIAERALSPGVNDPSTAVQALDEIHDLLRRLATRSFPSSGRLDPDGAVRLILPGPSWEDYVRLALDEIIHYGGGSLQVTRRLRALLDDCASVARPERHGVLEEQRALLEEEVASRFDQPLARARARAPARPAG